MGVFIKKANVWLYGVWFFQYGRLASKTSNTCAYIKDELPWCDVLTVTV